MTDRELLELAAKAAGCDVRWHENWQCFVHVGVVNITTPPTMAGQRQVWVPLDDDGDALRLAVKLGITLLPYPVYNENERHSIVVKQKRGSDLLRERNPTEVVEVYGDDPYAATRRAIVRAAAEIGKEMKALRNNLLKW